MNVNKTEKIINFYEVEFKTSGDIIDHNVEIKLEEDQTVIPFMCPERNFILKIYNSNYYYSNYKIYE